MSTVGWYLGWGLGIGASRAIVWGLCMIDAQLAHLAWSVTRRHSDI